jgi:hypothetical protein
MTVARSSQSVAESVSNVNPQARATQSAVEVVSNNAYFLMVSQVVAELIGENVPNDSAGQPQIFIST